MLKAIVRPTLALRFGPWACVCMQSRLLPDALKARLRPWQVLGRVFWCDRQDGA